MERVAIVGIIVEKLERSSEVNKILHEYAQYIEGRMGLPKVREDMNVISIVVKAQQPTIATMTGKLGMIPDVTCKALYSQK